MARAAAVAVKLVGAAAVQPGLFPAPYRLSSGGMQRRVVCVCVCVLG